MFEIHVEEKSIMIKNIGEFDAVQTFECGQCFRWRKLENGNWFGVVKGHAVELEWNGKDIRLHQVTCDDFKKIWYPYFDLGRDYATIHARLTKNDPVMSRAVTFGRGIRLLNQDFHEVLISFILSQNNGIPRIRKIIECLSENFGERIEYGGKDYFLFPTADRLAGLTCEQLKIIRAGYRDKYINQASRQSLEGLVPLYSLRGLTTSDARKEMLKFFGVGQKVADCVLLFSGIKQDVFPVDRWVKRVMAELYPECGERYEEIVAFAEERFGDLAGIAQQYLFYYARKMAIGMDKSH